MYATGTLLDEVAYISAALHWSLDQVLDLEHPDREHFLGAARALNGDSPNGEDEMETQMAAELSLTAQLELLGVWGG